MSRTASGWILSRIGCVSKHGTVDDDGCFDDVECAADGSALPVLLSLQEAVDADAEADSWGVVWQPGVGGGGPSWPRDLCFNLPAITTSQFRRACATFLSGVRLVWDKLHPRAIARYSNLVISLLITMMVFAEASGCWFQAVAITMVVVPRSDNGSVAGVRLCSPD